MQDLRRKRLVLAQQAQQQMLRSNMLVGETLSLLRRISQHALALLAKWQINRGRDLFANGGPALNLFSNGFDGSVRPQEPVGQRFVFAQQPQQQVLRLNEGAPELAGFVAREEDNTPGFFRIPLEHSSSVLRRAPPSLLPVVTREVR